MFLSFSQLDGNDDLLEQEIDDQAPIPKKVMPKKRKAEETRQDKKAKVAKNSRYILIDLILLNFLIIRTII